jgi:hypothetical protein
MTTKQLTKIARMEIAEWDRSKTMPRGLPIAILFAFIHRVTTGETVEEFFFKLESKSAPADYEI